MENLNDIKSMEIISFAFYEVLFIVLLLSLVLVVFFGFSKYFFRKKIPLVPKDFFQKDSKQLLYDFTLFVKQNKNENLEDELNTILEKIEKYKYCKEEIPIEFEVIEAMKEYICKLEENVSYK